MKEIFKKNELIPAIIQDYRTRAVFMLGYMNQVALQRTLDTGRVWFWSRGRKKLWMKGEISGNVLKVREISLDCDQDTLLINVRLIGNCVCHTGNKTCFFTKL